MDARILVVDDEPEIADLVEVYLKSEGCTVFKCGTGTEEPGGGCGQVPSAGGDYGF